VEGFSFNRKGTIMDTIRKIAYIFGLYMAATVFSYGALGLPTPMKSPPPKADDVGEVLFNPSDIAGTVFIGRDAVIAYIRLGEFMTIPRMGVPPELAVPTEILKPDKEDDDGGFKYYSGGSFATKQGKVFRFRRVSARVLEICGIDGGGYFVVPDTARLDPQEKTDIHKKK
jgi:hypothetical protein